MAQTFDAQSTTEDVLAGVDLSGKRVLVTGVSAGLGVETARVLAAHGAQVVGAARDLSKARAATEAVSAGAAPTGGLDLVELDLASLASVRACADALLADGRKFDVIIETQFGTNHLGHFVLVNRIASLLGPGGRLVSLSSGGHRFSDVDLDDPNFDRTPYQEVVAYGRSKTANILFAVEFDRRHRAAGLRATAVHPGMIQTELGRHMTPEVRAQMTGATAARPDAPRVPFKTVPQGAATSVWAGVVAPADEVGGLYCEDCHVAAVTEGQQRGGVRAYALDAERAKALWARSEEMVGERF
jgi:NAD(P)-dependent dehydrogenase (short-subunit alcohol dehydrogenase family)